MASATFKLPAYQWAIIVAGAYEPPKAAKEHETYTVCRVPSQSKLIAS